MKIIFIDFTDMILINVDEKKMEEAIKRELKFKKEWE